MKIKVNQKRENRMSLRLKIKRHLAASLDKDFFQQTICKNHLDALRIFHYPHDEKVSKDIWGVGEHTDYGLLTILMATDKGLLVKSV